MSRAGLDPAAEFGALRAGLGELAARVLAQVERALTAWDDADTAAAAEVVAADPEVDRRSREIEERILVLHQSWAAFAQDLRLLHIGLIAAVALERVGNLAVAIARLTGSVPPPEPGAAPVRAVIRDMGERSVDALAQAVTAISRGDVVAGERAARDARAVGPMLDGVLQAVTRAAGGAELRAWSAAAVLVARHLERVANNAAELGGRVRFLVTGEIAPPPPG